jgi:signal transduction histidine kinase/CheY-like chemotaxis protein/predicted hydrocarbon binding protein
MLNTVRVPEKFAPLFEHAQQYVTRYFADRKSSPERGTLEICGQRYVLVRAASMSVEFYDMVRSFYGEEAEALSVAHSLLFDIAHAMGLADAKTFGERMEVSDPIARLSAGPVHFAHAGWAFVDISADSNPSPDEHYYLLYDHPYSFESDSWIVASKPTDTPVCVMNAGYSSGWCEHSFGVPLVAVEILCRAKGDGMCRFIMAPPERIEGHIVSYAQHHPELAPSIVNYQIPGFFAKRTDQQLLRTNLELERRAQQRAHELSLINEQLERDIAERKRTEAELSASKELNERLIDVLPGGVVQVSKDGAILSANPEAVRILGLHYDEVARRYSRGVVAQTFFEDGTVATVADYPVTKAILSGTPQPPVTLGIRKPNGEIAWAVFRAVPTKDPATLEINGAVATFFDITERKHFEDKLRHTQKLESLGVLAGGVAHDFNNLLVTILGNATFAKNLAGVDARIVPLLDEIEVGARRAAELTKQMLDYSGQGKFKVETLELPGAVREMAKLLKALIPKQVELHYQFQEGLPPVEADATQIRQVIMNLITNAAESFGDKTGRVVISISRIYVSERELDGYTSYVAGPGTFLCVEVSDNGSGMDEDTRLRVFDPFFTTKFKGRGLGMAAALGIIRGHGGAISIESSEGVGTKARVLLPAKAHHDRPSNSAGERGTILVVDDDAGIQSLARRALSNKGYRVITASNGVEGVGLFDQYASQVSLIVMDLTMPQMSGIEALKRIRATGSRVPVLLSSGYNIDPAGVEAQHFNGFLEKPYDINELIEAVDRAISSAE